MIFYRSATSQGAAPGPAIATLRVFLLVALAAYPIGALILLFTPEDGAGTLVGTIVGFGFILLALMAATPVMGSRLQRIVAEQKSQLDEMEVQLRYRALSWGYSTLSAIVLLMLIYGAVAMDTDLWVPRTYDQWNGLFWGAFLYVTLLPTAFLAFTTEAGDDEEEG